MKNKSIETLVAVAFAAVCLTLPAQAAETEPLKLKLPFHTLKGTPEDLPTAPHIEPVSDKAPKPLDVPKGVSNVAAGKKVTSSVAPFLGDLAQVTDGKKDPIDDDAVEFKKGSQWIQVDLGASHAIYAIAMWHDHRYVQAMHDVILQISDDAEFKKDVTTVFNNDVDNSSSQGVGTDREYFELEFGKAVPVKGVKGRYVRGYSKGGSLSALNCWQELEVYALPAK
jgi:hypothetical protein